MPAPWFSQVEYNAAGFLAKNLDVLHAELPALLNASTDPLLAAVFSSDQAATDENAAPANRAAKGRGGMPKARGKGHGTLRARGLAGGFTRQLDALMATLAATTPHYVRCIKPNDQMAASQMDQHLILSQLRCAGTSQLLQLMGRGYPTRCEFEALAGRYRQLLPTLSAGLSGREFVQALLSALDLQPASLARPGGRPKLACKAPACTDFCPASPHAPHGPTGFMEMTGTHHHICTVLQPPPDVQCLYSTSFPPPGSHH
jgi:myosin heavy subunit